MFKNFDCLLRTGGRDRLVACFLKHKFQILTGENLILAALLVQIMFYYRVFAPLRDPIIDQPEARTPPRQNGANFKRKPLKEVLIEPSGEYRP